MEFSRAVKVYPIHSATPEAVARRAAMERYFSPARHNSTMVMPDQPFSNRGFGCLADGAPGTDRHVSDQFELKHRASRCAGEKCWVHNASAHHIATSPLYWNAGLQIALGICPHNYGHLHPNGHSDCDGFGSDVPVHECDACRAISD